MAKRRRKRAYHSGQVVPPRPPGMTWSIRWRENGRRRFQGGFETRELAERVLARVGGDLALGKAGLPLDQSSIPSLALLAEKFLERRKLTHRAAAEDEYRWKKHLRPFFGQLRPGDVDAAAIHRFAEAKLAEGLAGGTVRVLVAILSALFTDLIEQKLAQLNPAKNLPRATRRLARSTYDTTTTPFVEKLEDVRRIFLTLPEPINIGYAIGALGGLRTGEVLALKWAHVDLDAGRIHVRESVNGPLKDKESRIVPILDSLHPVLAAWKLKSGGEGLVLPPLRSDGVHIWKRTPNNYLQSALTKLKLDREGLGWYQATRHTFASQWVLAGGSIEKLSKVLGHYSVVVTERYTHLRPDLFSAKDLSTVSVDLETKPTVRRGNWAAIGQQPPRGTSQNRMITKKKPEQPCKPRTRKGGSR